MNVLNKLRPQREDLAHHCLETTGPSQLALSFILKRSACVCAELLRRKFAFPARVPALIVPFSKQGSRGHLSPHTQGNKHTDARRRSTLPSLLLAGIWSRPSCFHLYSPKEVRNGAWWTCAQDDVSIFAAGECQLSSGQERGLQPLCSLPPPHILLVRFPQTGRAREVRVEETKETPCCRGLRRAVSTTNS